MSLRVVGKRDTPPGQVAPNIGLPFAGALSATLVWVLIPRVTPGGLSGFLLVALVAGITGLTHWLSSLRRPQSAPQRALFLRAALYQWSALAVAGTAARVLHTGVGGLVLLFAFLLFAGMALYRSDSFLKRLAAWRTSRRGRTFLIIACVVAGLFLLRGLAVRGSFLLAGLVPALFALWIQISAVYRWKALAAASGGLDGEAQS